MPARRKSVTQVEQAEVDDPWEPTEEFGVVQMGEGFQDFCDRYQADPKVVAQLNEQELFNAAQARGFGSHHFIHEVIDEPNTPPRKVVGFHVFPGERLRLREHAEG